jgi:hypothetical protein
VASPRWDEREQALALEVQQIDGQRLLRRLRPSHLPAVPDRDHQQEDPDGDLYRQRGERGVRVRLGGLLPVASTVIVTTTARDTSHPNTTAAPLRTPRSESSTTMKAVSGSGRA